MKNSYPLKIVELKTTDEQIEEIQKLFQQTPQYFIKTKGHPPQGNEARKMLEEKPLGFSELAKSLGIYHQQELIGYIDLIKSFPHPNSVTIGLLMISELNQGKGWGKKSYQLLEQIISGWGNFNTIRIGILEVNSQVVPFWEKLNFQDTGKRLAFNENEISTKIMIFEKKIDLAK